MIRVYALIMLVGIGMLIVLTVSKLSNDAIGLILGVIFGLLAGLPGSLLVYTDNRRREMYSQDYARGYEAGKRSVLVTQNAPVNTFDECTPDMWELRQEHELCISRVRWAAEKELVTDRTGSQVVIQRHQIAERKNYAARNSQ